MGSNTLYNLTLPHTPIVDDWNQFFTALTGNFLARNATTGATEDNVHTLGSAIIRWKEAHVTDLFLNGSLFDPAAVGVDTANSIVSGATRTDSEMPDFIRASGAGATCTILATTTNLQITANSVSVTISSDIAVSALTVAPAANNTCLVNDTALAGSYETKYTGEDESYPLVIDTVGTEISNRIGEYICLKGASEYMLAFVEDATTLRHIQRGFFFDSSGAPIVREVLSNNDTLTIMSLGWVFMDNDGVTEDVSYTSPIYAFTEPSAPATDDYWFDLQNRVWKRYDGADYQTEGRMLIGMVVIDGTNCVASRSMDFTKSFDDFIEVELEVESASVVRSRSGRNGISSYAQNNEYYAHPIQWDITTDLESGLTEAATTIYYLYITENGAPKIATERPQNRIADLKGLYHPFHSWRYVGSVQNDASSDFLIPRTNNGKGNIIAKKICSGDSSVIFSGMFDINKNYEVDLSTIVPATDNVSLNVHVSDDFGVTFETANYDYNSATTGFSIATNVGSAGAESLSGTLKIYNPLNPNNVTEGTHEVSYRNNSAVQVFSSNGGHYEIASEINAIKISFSSGGVESGIVSLREIPT